MFLWWLSGEGNLEPLISALEEEGSSLAVSVVSIWEIQIKSQLGKLDLDISLAEMIERLPQEGIAGPLSLRHNHVLDLDRLPTIHRDPFDRALVAQARIDGLTLVTHDEFVLRYPVATLKL